MDSKRMIGPMSKTKTAPQSRMIGAMSRSSQPSILTFGVEIEFQAECLKGLDDEYAGHRLIADWLIEGGTPIDFFPVRDEGDPKYDKWLIEEDPSIRIAPIMATWSEEKRETTDLIMVELASRILKDEPQSFEEVRKVINHLRALFKTHNDRSTGLHVHVGNGNEGFELSTLKVLGSILLAYEEHINRMHPEDRTELDDRNFSFCKQLSKSARLEAKKSVHERLLCVHEVQSINAFIELVNSKTSGYSALGAEYLTRDRCCAVSFVNLFQTPYRNPSDKSTIEFRQHKGTTDPDEIVNWVTFVLHLVKYSQTATSAMLDHLLTQADSRAFGLQGLMREVGCPRLWDFYQSRLRDLPVQRPEVTFDNPPPSESGWFNQRLNSPYNTSLQPQAPVPEPHSAVSEQETREVSPTVDPPAKEDAPEGPSEGVQKSLERVEKLTNDPRLQRVWGNGSRTLQAMRNDRDYRLRRGRDMSPNGLLATHKVQRFKPIKPENRPETLDSVREHGEASSEAELELLQHQTVPPPRPLHQSRWTERSVLRGRVPRGRSRSRSPDPEDDDEDVEEEE